MVKWGSVLYIVYLSRNVYCMVKWGSVLYIVYLSRNVYCMIKWVKCIVYCIFE